MIAVSVVKAGAVLQQPVHTPKGVLLAPAGTVISESHLATFMSAGVAEVDIVGEVQAPKRQVDASKVAIINSIIENNFSLIDTDNSPFLRDLRAAATDILIDRVRLQEDAEEDQ